MKISVVVASFLGEYDYCALDRVRKFYRAINSFISQTYSDKELIVVSDGCEITQREMEQYSNNPQIKLFVSEKQPLFSGTIRNIGCFLATGDVISYLDSVTGDRCVPIKIGDKIDVVPMEDLFEKFRFLSYNKGEKEVIDIPNSIECYTLTPDKITKCDYSNASHDIFRNHFNDNQLEIIKMILQGMGIKDIARIKNNSYSSIFQSKNIIDEHINKGIYYISGKWTRINKLIRHFIEKKETYNITQKLGQTEITKDHSLIDIVDGKFKEVNFETFKNKGLRTISSIPINNIKGFKLSDYINCSKLDLSNGRINFIGNDGEHFITNDYYDESKILSLVRVLGFYVAEGSTSSRTTSLTWSLDNKNLELLKYLQKDIENISNVYTTIKDSKKQGYDVVHRLVTYNRLFTSIFPELCGINSRRKKIPSFIFSLEDKYKNEFIKYMYLGDGGLNKKNWHYTTISLRLISGLSILLKTIGIDHTFIYRAEKKSWAIIERKDVVIRPNPKTYKIQTDCRPKFVYDIQVEDNNHIFVDACGCVLLHNTDDFIGKNHLQSIANGFEYHKDKNVDWVYFDDHIIYRLNPVSNEILSTAKREVELHSGMIGTSSIAHKKEIGINWLDCDGYGHDWAFIKKIIDSKKVNAKIDGCEYYVCHIPTQVDC